MTVASGASRDEWLAVRKESLATSTRARLENLKIRYLASMLERLERVERERAKHRHLPIRSNGRVYFLGIDDIDWLEAADNYVKVHARDETHMIRQTLHRLEESLSWRGFIRVHRSAIVNIARIREIQPWFGGEYMVLLRDGTKVASSRAYRSALQALMA